MLLWPELSGVFPSLSIASRCHCAPSGAAAFAVASLLLVLAFATLAAKRVVERRARHATPEAICAEVQQTARSLNISTVYRTLELLEQLSLVTHTHLGHGAPTYHLSAQADHVHLVCRDCGKITEVSPQTGAGTSSARAAGQGSKQNAGQDACRSSKRKQGHQREQDVRNNKKQGSFRKTPRKAGPQDPAPNYELGRLRFIDKLPSHRAPVRVRK